jgi:hypothetical protein
LLKSAKVNNTVMQSEIYRIAYQLSLQGKVPSVALIRSKLSGHVSLPVIVQALQQWKLSPELGKDVPHKGSTENPEPNDNIAAQSNSDIEQRLTKLENKVDHLIALAEQTLADKTR